jgi:hypothetical protein
MEFNDLLRACGLAPADTALALHKPGDPRARLALCQIAEAEPDLFDAYQATHPVVPEATLKARRIMASFIVRAEGELAFCGLYTVAGWRDLTGAEIDAIDVFARLRARLGQGGFAADAASKGVHGRAVFDLHPLDALAALRGRLVVADPGGRNYMRRADTTALPVVEIARNARLAPPLPAWDRLTLSAEELRALPNDWAAGLRQWRGIYLIVDETDGARYVGAAYGEENLLGRWRAHVAGEAGVTRELRRRATARFRFSILELLRPTATIEEVTACEQGWMDRLHTRRFGLNAGARAEGE